jgi:hypothetical protein
LRGYSSPSHGARRLAAVVLVARFKFRCRPCPVSARNDQARCRPATKNGHTNAAFGRRFKCLHRSDCRIFLVIFWSYWIHVVFQSRASGQVPGSFRCCDLSSSYGRRKCSTCSLQGAWRGQLSGMILHFFQCHISPLTGMHELPHDSSLTKSCQFMDIWNRLYRERILYIGQDLDDEFANQVLLNR